MKIWYATLAVMLIVASCNRAPVREIYDFNPDWEFALMQETGGQTSWRELDLPHDWSIEGPFDKENPATPGGGALPGGKGFYRKTFVLDPATTGKRVFLEFDGIYRDSKVLLNGNPVGHRPCGYASFSYDITPFLHRAGFGALLADAEFLPQDKD